MGEISSWRMAVCLLSCSIAFCGSLTSSVHASTPAAAVTAAPAAAVESLDPQIVVWTDPLWNYEPAAAYSAEHDEFVVGWWTEQDPSTRDIWARRLRSDGTLLDVFNVAGVAGDILEQPAIAYCPLHDEYLIAFTNWYQATGDNADVQARRVAWNGGWMGEVFTISPGATEHILPSLSFSSLTDEYVVSYTNQYPDIPFSITAQRVQAEDGALVYATGVAPADGWHRMQSHVAFHPAANGGAGGYLIGYYAVASSSTRVPYKMALSDLSDVWGNPEQEAREYGPPVFEPELAAGEAGFLITWWEDVGSGYQVRARRVSTDGVALGSPEGFPVSGTYATNPATFALEVAYAYRQRYLVLWTTEDDAGFLDIHGIYVSDLADTTIGAEFTLSDGIGSISEPAARCSPASDCLVAYVWWNPPSRDIAARILRPFAVFSDGFESGDTGAWSATLP